MLPVASWAALPLLSANGQLTPPCPTSPVAVQFSVEPDNVPAPDPVTSMLPPHVAANVTFALVAVSGITVYLRLPHPVGGADAVTDDHVPANASMLTVGVGDVGEESSFLFLDSRSQPVDTIAARTNAAAREMDLRIMASRTGQGTRIRSIG